MRVLITFIIVLCFSLLSFAQQQSKQDKAENTQKAKVTFKELKITPQADRIKAKERKKQEIKRADLQPRKIETVKKADPDQVKTREYKAMGRAETSGPPVELTRRDVKTTATRADLLRALNDPQPIRPQKK